MSKLLFALSYFFGAVCIISVIGFMICATFQVFTARDFMNANQMSALLCLTIVSLLSSAVTWMVADNQ